MGKAYANRKKDPPQGDFFPTPRSLIWVARDIIENEFPKNNTSLLEPCAGNGVLVEELEKLGYCVRSHDLYVDGVDYLTFSCHGYDGIITNPPFSLWDEFVKKAKKDVKKVMMIGRLNYFGTAGRLSSGLWEGLKSIYCFNRYVDYRTPARNDGFFHVGAMATAWFIWEKEYIKKPTINFLDVQTYATLGNCKEVAGEDSSDKFGNI